MDFSTIQFPSSTIVCYVPWKYLSFEFHFLFNDYHVIKIIQGISEN